MRLWIYIFILPVVLAILTLTGVIGPKRETLIFVALSVPLMIMVLVISGLIGPEKLKNVMSKMQRWMWSSGVVFFPIDPYKPQPAGLNEGLSHLLPTSAEKKRLAVDLIMLVAILILLSMILQ